MKKTEVMFIFVLLLVAQVSALYSSSGTKIGTGHVLRIQDINVPELSPGEEGILKLSLKNDANFDVTDVRAKLNSPSQVQLFNDVNNIKISKIQAGDTEDISFRIIALPNAAEGIYGASLIVNYISYLGTDSINVGQETQDNYTFGMVVRSIPDIFMQIEDSDIYKGNDVGKVTFKFINNDIANVKFLTVYLQDSEDYEIISDNRKYIGDLDSDDFETIDFRIKLKKKKEEIKIPLIINYKDSMNKEYTNNLEASLKIRDAEDIGKNGKNYFWTIVILLLIIFGVGYYVYNNYFKKKKLKLLRT